MQAIRIHAFGGPEVLKHEEIPTPAPAARQVLVKLQAVGVNPVDVYIRGGNYGPRPFPFTPGFDAAGVVEALGKGVKGFKKGARVYVDGSLTGTYATHALCEASQIHPLPKALTFAQGAALGVPTLTAARALFQKALIKKGETLLVHGGSGAVGLAAIQLAKAAGVLVVATAGTPEGAELAKRAGAKHVINHREPNYLAGLPALTGGRGADVILEMLANVNLGKDLPALAKGGRVVVIGSRGPVEINPRDAMSRDAVIHAMSLFNCPPKDRAALHKRLAAAMKSGALKPFIGKEFPLAQADRAHETVMSPGAQGKIVLIP